ncbi:MarC family protein [Nitratifractor sp.]
MDGLWDQFLHQTITFAAILDPIGASAILLGMLPVGVRDTREIAARATRTIVAAFVLVFAGGEWLLRVFGIDLHALEVIGGIVLLLMAVEMLGEGVEARMLPTESARGEIGVIPLGIPILFGAGLFTTIIIFAREIRAPLEAAVMCAAFFLNAGVVYLALRHAPALRRLLGIQGENIVTKLMGLLTGAIAVQFILGGAVALVRLYWST